MSFVPPTVSLQSPPRRKLPLAGPFCSGVGAKETRHPRSWTSLPHPHKRGDLFLCRLNIFGGERVLPDVKYTEVQSVMDVDG
jgi:hypothetical protein